MKTPLYKIALFGSLLYVFVLLLSYLLSTSLPHLPEAGTHRGQLCYWTDAMVLGVQCGEQVLAGAWRELFYNLWLTLLFGPLFLRAAFVGFVADPLNALPVMRLVSVLAAYAAPIFLAYVFGKWIVRKLKRS